ncbi:MAG TPA: hypothetical protein VIL44_05195 [Micromonospora sp.]
MTQWSIDGWDPSFGAAFEAPDSPTAAPGNTHVDTDVELPASAWRPLAAPAGLHPPEVVLLVDGVRRNDALLWSHEEDGTSYPGLAASYAAGVVRCDLRRGAAELAGARVERGLFTASPSATDVVTPHARYPLRRVPGATELSALQSAVQPWLSALEVAVSDAARVEGDLLVVDGPLRNRHRLPRALGYNKTHHRQYLSPELTSVVTALEPGTRTPIFRLAAPGGWWWSWYLRLPGASGAPWAGIVRLECSIELGPQEAKELADLSVVTLPRFASTPYKDPRAPQNLVPIAGLERRLRGLLGDSALLHRSLALATRHVAAHG